MKFREGEEEEISSYILAYFSTLLALLNSALNLTLFLSKVSWIRKRDLHILTVGILTYTNDQRFQSLHSEGSDEWTLRISSPQPRDSGTYECQVSTEPKISQGFRLNVVGEYAVCVCVWLGV